MAGRHGSSRLISRAILFSDKVLTKIQWSISNVQENQLSLAMFLPVHFLVDKVLVPVLSALLSVGYSSVALIHQQFGSSRVLVELIPQNVFWPAEPAGGRPKSIMNQ